MRKDVLLKDWCKKIRGYKQRNYVIKIGTYEVWDGTESVNVVYTVADLVINGEIVATEELETLTTETGMKDIPASAKRKRKAFVEYFKACDAFENNIYCIPNLVIV